jgi:hypothetical protein
MPAGGNVLKPEEIWDLVNYVRSLPYELEPRVPNEFAAAGRHDVQVAQQEVAQQEDNHE